MKYILQALGLALGLLANPTAHSQAAAWPERPVKWIVPYSAGSFSDTLCRGLAIEVGALLGQPLAIENLPGAGATTGTAKAKAAPPDGYTILYAGSSAFAVNVSLMQLPYHPVKDFQAITMIGSVNYVLAANPELPVKNVADLTAYLKANPGKVNFGSPGNGTSSHLTMEMLKKSAGWRMTHVPYKGSTPAVTDLMAGHVQLLAEPYASVGPHIRNGKLKALAVTGSQRMRELPDVPTFSELGLPGFELSLGWFGLVAPAGTPKEIVAKLNTAFTTALRRTAPRLLDLGVLATPGTPEAFTAFVESEIPRYGRLISESGLKLE
jgi:tripartite-type tricarboxylate transporter receptor subunit TctC